MTVIQDIWLEGLKECRATKYNWDSYNGLKTTKQALKSASLLVDVFSGLDWGGCVHPLPYGGVRLYIAHGDIKFDITISPKGLYDKVYKHPVVK